MILGCSHGRVVTKTNIKVVIGTVVKWITIAKNSIMGSLESRSNDSALLQYCHCTKTTMQKTTMGHS